MLKTHAYKLGKKLNNELLADIYLIVRGQISIYFQYFLSVAFFDIQYPKHCKRNIFMVKLTKIFNMLFY